MRFSYFALHSPICLIQNVWALGWRTAMNMAEPRAELAVQQRCLLLQRYTTYVWAKVYIEGFRVSNHSLESWKSKAQGTGTESEGWRGTQYNQWLLFLFYYYYYLHLWLWFLAWPAVECLYCALLDSWLETATHWTICAQCHGRGEDTVKALPGEL